MNPKEEDLYKIVVELGPPGVSFEALDYEKLVEAMRHLKGFEPSDEQKARARHVQATSALEHLKVEDLDHSQRVGLFNRLVELLASG